ncbi:immunoglobulin-like domain-containing protein [Terribacillus halophilus]|uniref:immunoglobulin-like domain-containing protein n=1 Tax=Terribacillus halophilus TaxID=361279 RepID=UPI000984499A|nr:immunoglobulin-like domain-containing protein [Terribacillus halophilus]
MKKRGLTLCLVMMLTGCNQQVEHLEPSTYENKILEMDQSTGITLVAEDVTITMEEDEIVYKIRNNTDKQIGVGREYVIEKKVNGEWMQVPFKKNIGFLADAQILFPHSEGRFTASFDVLDYNISEGEYRLIKPYGAIILYATFNVIR